MSTSDSATRTSLSPLFRVFAAAHVGPLRGGGLWGSVGVVLAFLAISIPQYGQPYVIDEAVFPYVAEGILKYGAPFYYNGYFNPHELGLWHPPLYDYLLALQVFVWGMSTFAVRAFGAMCVIASFFILALALRRTAPNLRQYGYVILAALFLLNPLVISDAQVPDIDGTLGVLVVTMALWISTIVAHKTLSWRIVLGVVGFATLAVSTKFEIAAIVAIIVAGAALIAPSRRWWKLLWVVIAFVVGTAVSLGLQVTLGAILKFDALSPFDYLFGSLGSRPPGRSGLHGAFYNLVEGPGSNLVWIGPAIFASAVVTFIVLLIVKPIGVSKSLAGLAVVSSLLVVAGYSYITASPFDFPKYTAVVVPGLALASTLIVTLFRPAPSAERGRKQSTTWVLSVAYIVVLIVGTAGVFAIAWHIESRRPRDVAELLMVSAIGFICIAIATAAFVFAMLPGAAEIGGRRLRRPIVIGLMAALVFTPIMVQTGSSLVNLVSPFSTRYYYRETGMSEFLTRARKIISMHDSIIGPKDVGLQLPRPFYEDASLLPLSPSQLTAKLNVMHAAYLVTRNSFDYSQSAYPASFRVLREYYVPVLSAPDSDFVLWKLK